MRRIVILVVILCFAIRANADCCMGGISVWPYSDSISTTPIILIEGYGEDTETIRAISTKQALLVNGKHSVKLCVEDYVPKTGYHPAQILFSADGDLQPGKTYELVIPDLIESVGHSFDRYSLNKRWRVITTSDMEPPIFAAPPTEMGKFRVGGCPIYSSVQFKANIKEVLEYLVKVKLTVVNYSETMTYYIFPNQGFIKVGGSECESFKFCHNLGASYQVEFRLVDGSGNRSLQSIKSISFTSPNGRDLKKLP